MLCVGPSKIAWLDGLVNSWVIRSWKPLSYLFTKLGSLPILCLAAWTDFLHDEGIFPRLYRVAQNLSLGVFLFSPNQLESCIRLFLCFSYSLTFCIFYLNQGVILLFFKYLRPLNFWKIHGNLLEKSWNSIPGKAYKSWNGLICLAFLLSPFWFGGKSFWTQILGYPVICLMYSYWHDVPEITGN
jgi:hypothetical protein